MLNVQYQSLIAGFKHSIRVSALSANGHRLDNREHRGDLEDYIKRCDAKCLQQSNCDIYLGSIHVLTRGMYKETDLTEMQAENCLAFRDLLTAPLPWEARASRFLHGDTQ